MEIAATRLMLPPGRISSMSLAVPVLALGPLGSPPGIVVTLVLLALIIIVGRFLLALAWRLVLIALTVLAVLWVLAALGFSVGAF